MTVRKKKLGGSFPFWNHRKCDKQYYLDHERGIYYYTEASSFFFLLLAFKYTKNSVTVVCKRKESRLTLSNIKSGVEECYFILSDGKEKEVG